MLEEPNVHLLIYQRDLTDDAATLETSCAKDLLGNGQSCEETENAVQPVVGPIFHSFACRTSLTMRVAGLVDRGPAARSTRAELLGDRVRAHMSGCFRQRKYTARLRQRAEWAVVCRGVVDGSHHRREGLCSG